MGDFIVLFVFADQVLKEQGGFCYGSRWVTLLYCLYLQIKFLKSKEGSAMVQMGDSAACDRALQNLNNSFFMDSKMQLGRSKQAFLQDVPNPHELPDGAPSFKDYMGSRNNRFTNPTAASKNHILYYSCGYRYIET